MRPLDSVCIVLTLGAALGLKDHLIKLQSSAVKQRWMAIGSSVFQARPRLGTFDASKQVTKGKEQSDAEESLRLVVYLSCWGPNWGPPSEALLGPGRKVHGDTLSHSQWPPKAVYKNRIELNYLKSQVTSCNSKLWYVFLTSISGCYSPIYDCNLARTILSNPEKL